MMDLSNGENHVIVAGLVKSQYQRVSDGWTTAIQRCIALGKLQWCRK